MIRTHGLTKRFGSVLAVDGVDLDVREGDATASSAPTARARPRRCGCCSGWCSRPRATVELLGRADAEGAARRCCRDGRRAGRGAGGVRAPVRPGEPRAARRQRARGGGAARPGGAGSTRCWSRSGSAASDDRPVQGVLARDAPAARARGGPAAHAAAAGARRADQRPRPAGHPRDPRAAAARSTRPARRSSCPATCSPRSSSCAPASACSTAAGSCCRTSWPRCRRRPAAPCVAHARRRPSRVGAARRPGRGARRRPAAWSATRDAGGAERPAGRRRRPGQRARPRAAHASSRSCCERTGPARDRVDRGRARRDRASSCAKLLRRPRTWVTIAAALTLLPTLVAVLLAVTDIAPRPGEGPAFLSAVLANGALFPAAALAIVLPLFLPVAVAVVAGDCDRGRGAGRHAALPAGAPGRAHPAAGGQAGRGVRLRAASRWSSVAAIGLRRRRGCCSATSRRAASSPRVSGTALTAGQIAWRTAARDRSTSPSRCSASRRWRCCCPP